MANRRLPLAGGKVRNRIRLNLDRGLGEQEAAGRNDSAGQPTMSGKRTHAENHHPPYQPGMNFP